MTHTVISGKSLAMYTHFSTLYSETTLTHHVGEERLRKKNSASLNLDIT